MRWWIESFLWCIFWGGLGASATAFVYGLFVTFVRPRR